MNRLRSFLSGVSSLMFCFRPIPMSSRCQKIINTTVEDALREDYATISRDLNITLIKMVQLDPPEPIREVKNE